ncbi:hypothetical protein E2C01_059863 [Portunus trituberculatus]|uniref:Uncharacterized protein n=1 Tax=Portunus trituberculatus TaxID=210409 RepID=A0A5B7H9U2_PORTR|nr:hypothetical protein [Portunus trituberculatus]
MSGQASRESPTILLDACTQHLRRLASSHTLMHNTPVPTAKRKPHRDAREVSPKVTINRFILRLSGAHDMQESSVNYE